MELEILAKKQSRLKKTAKKRMAKSSGTLAGQVSRGRVNRGYAGKKAGAQVTIKI